MIFVWKLWSCLEFVADYISYILNVGGNLNNFRTCCWPCLENLNKLGIFCWPLTVLNTSESDREQLLVILKKIKSPFGNILMLKYRGAFKNSAIIRSVRILGFIDSYLYLIWFFKWRGKYLIFRKFYRPITENLNN